jgi:hypothetical protein
MESQFADEDPGGGFALRPTETQQGDAELP